MEGSRTRRIIENRTPDVNTLVKNKVFTTEAQRTQSRICFYPIGRCRLDKRTLPFGNCMRQIEFFFTAGRGERIEEGRGGIILPDQGRLKSPLPPRTGGFKTRPYVDDKSLPASLFKGRRKISFFLPIFSSSYLLIIPFYAHLV